MKAEKKHMPDHAASLLQYHYESGHLKEAMKLRISLYEIYGVDTVDGWISEKCNIMYDCLDKELMAATDHDDPRLCNFYVFLGTVIYDLAESGEVDPWAIKIVQRGLGYIGLSDCVLTYIESDNEIHEHFLPKIKEVLSTARPEGDTRRMKLTLAYMEELVQIRNAEYEISPDLIQHYKDALHDDDEVLDDDADDVICYVRRCYNDRAVNTMICKVYDEYQEADNLDSMNRVLCQSFESINLITDQLAALPVRAIEYVLAHPKTEDTDDVILVAFDAISELCYSTIDYNRDYLDARFLEYWLSKLTEHEAEILNSANWTAPDTISDEYHATIGIISDLKTSFEEEEEEDDM